jgi:hypothetical protein
MNARNFTLWESTKILSLIITIFLSSLTDITLSQQREDYIAAMKIDKLLDKEIKGDGIVVMDIGPGVYQHTGLMDKWRGNVSPTGYDWYQIYNEPNNRFWIIDSKGQIVAATGYVGDAALITIIRKH